MRRSQLGSPGSPGPKSTQLRRARQALALAGLLLLSALGLLLARSLAAAKAEQQLRREALAARVFDELEATLAAFVAGEEARPFVQWRHEWVPPTQGKSKGEATLAAPQPSPLATLPTLPFVRGYFQIDPDDRFTTPLLTDDLANDDVDLADIADIADIDPELVARVDELQALNRDLLADARLAYVDVAAANNAKPQAQQARPQQQVQQQAVPEDLQVQQALDQQSIARQRKNAALDADDFDPDAEQLANFLGSGSGAGTQAVDRADLRTTPFVGQRLGDDRLRLLRTVEIDGRLWLQGLILDRPALEDWLAQELVGAAAIDDYLALDWSPPAVADPDRGLWIHEFGPPFVDLRLGLALAPAEVWRMTSARWILGLGVGLALALIVGLVAVERSLAALLARAEERERFIAAVTHELRTPLTSIRMYSEMLEQGMVGDRERQRSYHATIRTEAERLSRLVEQILTLAQLEGRPATEGTADAREPITEVIARVVALLEPQARARGLSIEVDAGETEPVPGDALTQILTNLLDNAIKFSPVGAAPITLTVDPAPGDRLRLRIRDHGPGVEAEVLPTIFEAFVRSRRADEQAIRGTGIGLAVVRALVERLGGSVCGRNHPDGGFEVELIV